MLRLKRSVAASMHMNEMGGYWTGIAVNDDGEVLIGSSGVLMLPSGEEIAIEGDVYNLDW